jgi:hypothetical protein
MSEVRTQYLVRTFNSECFAKKVFPKAIKSQMFLLLASAHQLVNSKLFEVLLEEPEF